MDVAVRLEGEESPVVPVCFKQHSDTLVEPAWEAVFEESAIELVPALVAEHREGPLSADAIRHASAIEVVGAGFYLKIHWGLAAGEADGEDFPLLAVGEEINGEWSGGFDWLGELALIAAIGGFHKAGDLRKHQRLKKRGVDFVMCGGQFQSGAELVLPALDGFQRGEVLAAEISNHTVGGVDCGCGCFG